MLRLEGKVQSVITRDPRTDKEGKTHDGYSQVQLLVEELLDNDQVRYGIQTMTTARPDDFRKLEGQTVAVPVRVYVKGGSIAFTMPAASAPQVVNQRTGASAG